MNFDYFWQNEKVVLRAVKEGDADSLYEALCDTTLRMQAEGGIALPVTYDVAEDMIQYAIKVTREGSQLWFAVVNNENRMVGYAILGYINERAGNAQCDVTIFPAYQRKGYGKCTYDIILRYAFYECRLHKVNAFVMEGNDGGRAFLSAIGFSLEAERNDCFYSGGKYYKQYYYGITKEEFVNRIDAGRVVNDAPDSCLGNSADHMGELKTLFCKRPYFWHYEDIIIRGMTEEDYMKNREIMFSSWDARFYDNDVRLPLAEEGLTDKEEEHMEFGGDGTRIEFAVIDLDGKYVGNVNLHSIDTKNGTFSISFYFLRMERGKGYATKAVALIVKYAFDELRLNKLNVCVNDGNEASAKIMRRLGCRVEGIWRDNVYYNGKFTDVVLFGLTKDEFHHIFDDSNK